MFKNIKWLILSFLLLFLILAFNQSLITTYYSVKSDKVKRNTKIRLALITDLHSTLHGKEQKKLIAAIITAQPDLILLAGDIADDETPIRGTELLLQGIKDVAPLYYVAGNHEYRADDINQIRDTIQSYGVVILADNYFQTTVNGSPVVIAGVDDPGKKKSEVPTYDQVTSMQQAFSNLKKKEGFKILLAHRPEKIESYAEYPFDLVVSGHAHGGQVRIPFILNGLIAPGQGFFPKYAGGIYAHDGLTHVVSRGLSVNYFLPRVFNRPELVIIDVVGI